MSHDDFKFEPVRGLPEALPPGEVILWQGEPAPWRLARESLALYWVAGYFALLAVWRVGVSSTEMPLVQALPQAIPFVVVGVVACAILYLLALIQAKSTVYTLTNKRVGMRIGAALTMTLNLPYTQIEDAGLDLRPSGHGTIAFALKGDTRFSYILCWPHVKPWRIRKVEPALRCIPDAQRVAEIFAEAAEARVAEPKLTLVQPTAMAAE
ncbi:photosynthetic complex putative assembly protein PuhB [Aestuariibius sp. 2305UL40-4]|uniref:photosynthetic complex putative assembly protein PuhB n=1 Tax=Aestuariibius violaceus TaxID=3234132 RepID=UPI00345E4297